LKQKLFQQDLTLKTFSLKPMNSGLCEFINVQRSAMIRRQKQEIGCDGWFAHCRPGAGRVLRADNSSRESCGEAAPGAATSR
jgi:hypothetical protein